MTANGLDGDLN